MAIFNFRLREIEDITPWGLPGEPSLGWFGLTDGWYWLSLGNDEIFRVKDAARANLPYIDYQIVRLWEDLLFLLPDALDPIPLDVREFLTDPFAWHASVQKYLTTHNDDRDPFRWWIQRQLDTGHLVEAPGVWFWREDGMKVAWDSPANSDLWGGAHGVAAFSTEDFLDEVRSFHDRLMAQMEQRVSHVVAAGGIPGVSVDLDRLAQEQRDRSSWLARALERPPNHPTDWDLVRSVVFSNRWRAL